MKRMGNRSTDQSSDIEILCSVRESSVFRTRNMKARSFLFMVATLFSGFRMLQAGNTLNASQILRDGETMISADGIFELGFFSPGMSKSRYVGIWYKKIAVTTVVWVANRGAPLANASGTFRVMEPGILAVLDESEKTVWSTNASAALRNPVAQLLDTGNLVVRDTHDDGPENFLWQSFNYPTDTLLPGMKLGWNFRTGQEVYLSSWKSEDDPALGEYTYHCGHTGYPQLILRKGGVTETTTGPWNGIGFTGVPNLKKNTYYRYGLTVNENEVYYHYELINSAVVSRFILNLTGHVQRWFWVDQTRNWIIYLSSPGDDCDAYKFCGANGICNMGNSPICGCLDKFVPTDADGWNKTDWTKGCVRRTSLDCQKGDVFMKYSGIKLPDTKTSRYNESLNLEECEALCLSNCSCVAYTNLDIRGTGCLLWFDELADIRTISPGKQDIHIRVSSSELDSPVGKHLLKVLLPLGAGILLLLCVGLILYFRKRKRSDSLLSGRPRLESLSSLHDETMDKDFELPVFDLLTINKATDYFSLRNKIGEGGFGPVYKGKLEDGKEIAVKRLSGNSNQGVEEFKNEIICIVKLQHRNLVKLLGCCIQGEETMLIYEYLPNKSLDLIIFDPEKSSILDWPKRLDIINGVARGLMYLHQDSCLRIIHRDLKASNILLDSDMKPKISDFGMARMFGGNETGANTSRVVGTYGYMSPEYAIDGLFSVKSDVYSFGVLLLEIASGKRNRGFYHKDHHLNLLGHAWMLYREARTVELIDDFPHSSSHLSEILRSIHIGLLCVQQHPEDRPTMSSVVLMLGNDGALPEAKAPGFFAGRSVSKPETSISSITASSVNDISLTLIEAR